ncbi:MAG: TonB family protein [Kofleriaceae bacterium]
MNRLLVATAFATALPMLAFADDPNDDTRTEPITPERQAINLFGQRLDDGDIPGAVALLSPNVRVGALWFLEPSCAKQFAKPHVLEAAEREQLIKCLIGLNPKHPALASPPLNALEFEYGMLVGVTIDSTGVSMVHAPGSAPNDPPILTNDGRADHAKSIDRFRPRPAVMQVVYRGKHDAKAIVRVCTNLRGKVTKARVLKPSGYPRFDREALATAKGWRRTAYKPYDAPEPVCEIITLEMKRLLYADFDAPREDPPPPPRFSASRHSVTEDVLEQARTGGSKTIPPDARTLERYKYSGRMGWRGVSADVCLKANGELEHVELVAASPYEDYNAKVSDTITKAWRFRPVLVDGKPTPVCARVSLPAPAR